MLKFRKDFSLRVLSITIITSFLATGIVYPTPSNAFVSSGHKLRLPIGEEDDTLDRIEDVLAAIKPHEERGVVALILASLEEARSRLATQVEYSAIMPEEQKVQDGYLQKAYELISQNVAAFETRPEYERGYLSFIITEWAERLQQYPDKPEMIYGQTRAEAYISYAELVLLEVKAAVAIAEGRYTELYQQVEYDGEQYPIRIYILDDLPWQVVEYRGDGPDGIVTRVYFYPDGYQNDVLFERAQRAALVTGVAITDIQHDIKALGLPLEGYYRQFITSDPLVSLPGDSVLWVKRFVGDHATVMAISLLGVAISSQRIFREYTRTPESWRRHLKHEAGHRVEEFYNVEDANTIPRWFQEGTKNAVFWSGAYDWLFLRDLIRGNPIVRLTEMDPFPGGAAFPHATLFCDFVDEVTGGRLAKGWVEIERRVGQEGLTFEQAFESENLIL